MPSTFTPNHNLEKIADGEQDDTWGVSERANQDKLDDVLGGYLSKSVAGSSNVTLTESEYDHRTIELTGTLTGNIDVILPALERVWRIYNNTSGAFTLTCKVSGQAGFEAVQGKKYDVTCNGTDVSVHLSDETLPVTGGGTGAADAATARSNLAVPGLADANTFTDNQTIQLADDGSDEGPYLTLDRVSTSPVAGDNVGLINIVGRSDAAALRAFARFAGKIIDPSDGAEYAEAIISSMINGAITETLHIGQGVYTPSATGGDQGADTINAGEYYRDGSLLLPLTTQGDILYRDGSGMQRLPAGSNARQFLNTQGSGANPQWATPITPQTVQGATGTETEFDFTSLPSGLNRITIMFAAMSLTGTDHVLIRIGDSGGFATTGYVSNSIRADNNANGSGAINTGGFVVYSGGGASALSGHMVLTLQGSNRWIASHTFYRVDNQSVFGGGWKALSGTLDRVRITRTGTDTFDGGGIVNVFVE